MTKRCADKDGLSFSSLAKHKNLVVGSLMSFSVLLSLVLYDTLLTGGICRLACVDQPEHEASGLRLLQKRPFFSR